MATVEQSLAKRLKEEGFLRLPLSPTDGIFDNEASASRTARERMRRIVKWTGREAKIEVDHESSEVVATLTPR